MEGNYAKLVLDEVHTASGTAPGALKTLNLDNYVFFGGHLRQQGTKHGRSTQVANGFKGCMDSIYLNGQELPLNNKPRASAHIEEWVDLSHGCLLTATEDCSSNPCQNGGVCNPSPTGGRLPCAHLKATFHPPPHPRIELVCLLLFSDAITSCLRHR